MGSALSVLREEVVHTASVLLERGLVSGTSGNVAARLPGTSLLLVTPSGIPFPDITPADLPLVDLNTGRQVEGTHRPSVETPVHRSVLRSRPDLFATIHTHSIHASAVAATRRNVPPILDSMAARLGGPLRVVPFAISGTPDLQLGVADALSGSDACLLANHGAFVGGPDLASALGLAEFVEHVCQVYVLSHLAGGPVPLTDDEVERERAWYLASYGQKAPGPGAG